MCHPDLTRGLCQICWGQLTPETTFVDRDGNTWDVHKGVCAIESGAPDAVPYFHQDKYWWYMKRINAASTAEVRRIIVRAFTKWIREIAEEDHHV